MGENSLFAFALTVTLIELPPGPNMGYLAVVAASAERRARFTKPFAGVARSTCFGLPGKDGAMRHAYRVGDASASTMCLSISPTGSLVRSLGISAIM
ncbi:hypothetical protein AB7M49_001166 [Bradyrhizobium elkanii]